MKTTIDTICKSIDDIADALIAEAYNDDTCADPEAVESYMLSFSREVKKYMGAVDDFSKEDK